jgi:hypothetical protein
LVEAEVAAAHAKLQTLLILVEVVVALEESCSHPHFQQLVALQ